MRASQARNRENGQAWVVVGLQPICPVARCGGLWDIIKNKNTPPDEDRGGCLSFVWVAEGSAR